MKTLMVMYVVFGALLSGLAIPLWLERIPPNWLYGFRVPGTLNNPDVWYKVNRYMARWLLATGLITIAAAVGFYFMPDLSLDRYAWLCLAAFALPFSLGVWLSFRYLRRLQA